MLDRLTAASFAPHVGEVFLLRVDATTTLEARLAAAEEVPWASGGPGKRVPFSVLFLGPRWPVLPQRIYRLEHHALGALELFLVPIRRDESGVTYEAVFN